MIRTGRAAPTLPDGKLTFDKFRRSSSPATARATTSRTTPIQRNDPENLADAWVHMCPAQVYELGADTGDGLVHVDVTPLELRPVRGDLEGRQGAHPRPRGGWGLSTR